ncbi:M56 family metallopeptidase [Candidatus Palauibacter sp.]|uniref:M56 family metallopeptidase n=1 Tax=Candidatus Palauibacter sp. TaxID=3101350 RepID=UPI003B526A4F
MMDSLLAPDSLSMPGLVIRATILLSAALALAWLARKGSAGVRHLLWTMTFALLLGLPVLSLLAPSWDVPILPSPGSTAPQRPSPLMEAPAVDVARDARVTLAAPDTPLPKAGSAAVAVADPVSPPRSIPLALLLWGIGCTAALASLGVGAVRCARLVLAASPLRDPIALRQAEAVRRRLGIRSEVRLLVSPTATTPMTGGIWRPVVLLPTSSAGWSSERWSVVLTHEMTHVYRRDVLRQFMSRVAVAIYWIHPLTWLAARFAAVAREEACDEKVLALGTRPSDYATHLLALAADANTERPVLSLPMGQRAHPPLEKRILAILNAHPRHRSTVAAGLVAAAIGIAGMSAAVAHPVHTAQSDTVTALVETRIGDTGLGGAADEYIFGDVTSVAADRQGRIYVADRISPSVRAFGPDGEFMAWIGREGEGPGEFTWPVDILPAADGTLFVRGSRITTFATSASSAYPDSVADTWSIPPYANSESWRARLVDGAYYYPHYQNWIDGPSEYFYMKYGPEGLMPDTVHVPDLAGLSSQRTAYYRVGRRGGRMVHGLNSAPFAPHADWDMTGRGTIIMGDGETYRLYEFAQGGELLRTIDGPEVERRPVPRAERADSMRALEARIDSLPVPLEEVLHVAPEILRGEIPDSLPAFISIHVGASDRIWVERWPAEGMASSRHYDVLEYDGRYAGSLVVPAPLLADPPPFFGEDTIVGVVMDPTFEVHSVVSFRFRLPE